MERALRYSQRNANPRVISPFIEAGGVSAAILTVSGNVYTGVRIDTACSLGMCAELIPNWWGTSRFV